MMSSKLLPPDQLAANIRKVLDNKPADYRNFGVYRYFVKAFLKKYYTKENLYMLGEYEQPEVVEKMPKYSNFEDAMHDALLMWRANWENNMGRAISIDLDSDEVVLFDEDAGL